MILAQFVAQSITRVPLNSGTVGFFIFHFSLRLARSVQVRQLPDLEKFLEADSKRHCGHWRQISLLWTCGVVCALSDSVIATPLGMRMPGGMSSLWWLGASH